MSNQNGQGASWRQTPIRQEMLKLLKSSHLVTAGQVFEELNHKLPCDKVTVYRNLDFLVEKGMVCKHFSNEGEGLYELRQDHHHHLVCNRCGTRYKLINCPVIEMKAPTGFEVDHHHLEFFGTCQKCQRKEN
jgi:Fe2+ or Zn2+ uptake regulation protein